MKTADFDFDLPPELIAQEPLAERDQSRMMVVDRAAGTIAHQQVLALPDYVQAGDLMVVNDTRVIPARLTGSWQDTVGKIEILLVEDLGESCWSVMIKSGRPVKAGMQLQLGDGRLRGTVSAAYPGGRAEITFASSGSFEVALQELGTPPVPPYIRRPADRPDLLRLDHERYQTLYATTPGAVAAPTAGLHLSERLLARLEAKTVARARVTLHVGPGTFKPVKTDAITDHVMESERYRVPAETATAIHLARLAGGQILAVGSTTVRTLETVAREHGAIQACAGRSSIFIYPPFPFQVVDRLLTNFHLPCSTLLMMVAAFAGHNPADAGGDGGRGLDLIQHAYREAVEQRYRFYSYGDCMLII